MKTFHQYANGYINIDEFNIYFTSTGNWSETKTLSEKRFGKSNKKNLKIISIYIFLSIVLIAVLAKFAFVSSDSSFKLIGLAIGVFGVYKLYNYFSTETGERFYIPKLKIIDILIEENDLIISFKTLDGQNDSITIQNTQSPLELVANEIRTIET